MHRSSTRIYTLSLVVLFTAATAAACRERSSQSSGHGLWGSSEPQPNAALQALIENKSLREVVAAPEMRPAEQARLADQVQRFYKNQNYRLIWIDGNRPSRRYRELAKVLDAADEHGLPAELYRVSIVEPAGEDTTIATERAPELDVKATATFFRYFLHLTGGRLDPRELQPLWTLRPQKPDLVEALTTAVNDNDLVKVMERLQPKQPDYHELQRALVRYRAIAAKGGWPTIPASTRLKPGQQSPVLAALRQRLAIEGDLDPRHEKDPGLDFDPVLVNAVKRFEERHRLEPDGVLDAEAVNALNSSVQQRIRTIELALERWRWLPDSMPARYMMVNIPDFRLDLIENGTPVIDIRVVVGAPDNKTPIFADEMTHVVFSPYWNVPPGIAREETIPRAVVDPSFIARNNMEVVGTSGEVLDPSSVDWSNPNGLRIRQRPGNGNALGGVKFMFPNNFDVYLHDTNATMLFDRLERDLSHGCVRVEEPHKLAQYVLRDLPEWTPGEIDRAMKSGQEKYVKLKTSIPVYLLYVTATVHKGGVRFLKDLYGYDADHAAKLWPARR